MQRLLHEVSRNQGTVVRMAKRTIVRLILVGPPGGGKGVMNDRLCKDFSISPAIAGELIRKNVREGTEVGKLAKPYIEKGVLLPDEVTWKLLKSELTKLAESNTNYLIDGFPRTVKQAEMLDQFAEVTGVIHLNVPFSVIVERLKKRWIHPGSGRVYNLDFNPPRVPFRDDATGEPLVRRDDDREETVMNRLRGYEQQTMPVLQHYQKMNKVQEFRGNTSNEIWPHVFDYAATLLTPKSKTVYK